MVTVRADLHRQEFLQHNSFTVVTENADLVATDEGATAATALAEGRHVLTTHAVAIALPDSDRIAVDHVHRCAPMIVAAARAIRTGKIGLPWNVQADCLVNMSVEEALGVVDALVGLPVVHTHVVPAGSAKLLSLDHEKGLTSTITVGGNAGVHRYRISGSHGVLLVDATKPRLSTKDVHIALLDDLHRAITTGGKPATSQQDARRFS